MDSSSPLIPPRFVNAPAHVIYDDDLPAPFVVSLVRLAGLTWNHKDEDKDQLPPLTIGELAIILGGKQRRAWEHLHALRRLGLITWTKVEEQLSIRLVLAPKRKPPSPRMQNFAYAGDGDGDQNNNDKLLLLSSSSSPSPSTPMQSFALDERVRANLATLAEFDVSDQDPGALDTAQLEYVTPAFIRAWGAELMNTPGVRQLGRLLLHKLQNTQSLPRQEERRGGSRKSKTETQPKLLAGEPKPGNASAAIELPADVMESLQAIGWTDDVTEVKEHFIRDPEYVRECLLHAQTSQKAQNKAGVFRYRLRQGRNAPTPRTNEKPSSTRQSTSTSKYVDDNDLF